MGRQHTGPLHVVRKVKGHWGKGECGAALLSYSVTGALSFPSQVSGVVCVCCYQHPPPPCQHTHTHTHLLPHTNTPSNEAILFLIYIAPSENLELFVSVYTDVSQTAVTGDGLQTKNGVG